MPAAAWAWWPDIGRVSSGGWRDAKQLADVVETGLAGGAGEQAVMVDAVEPLGRSSPRFRRCEASLERLWREDVEQEAADELVGGEGHDLLPVDAVAARAVGDWSWRADDAAIIPALFRFATRIELRCSKAAESKGLTNPLRDAAMTWLNARAGAAPWEDLSDAAALPLQRAALERARQAGDQAAIARAALALATSSVTSAGETTTLLNTAATAAHAANAPAPVRNFIVLRQVGMKKADVAQWRADLRTLLANADYAKDPLSADTLRLLISQPSGKTPPPDDATTLQAAVADDPALPVNHPLKIAALLGQANVLAARGDLTGARSAFQRTGLSGEQCAELDLSPTMRSSGASSSDYPMAAARMGFEGWVVAEADVTADGRTAVPRATIAYPPFVFVDTAVGIAKDARYTSSFRPEGTLACRGVRMPIRFLLPN